MSVPDHIMDSNITHSYPLNDLREHDTKSRGLCWCRPRIIDYGVGCVVAHNSADGREDYETGKRKRH